MATSIFDDKAAIPNDEMVGAVLADTNAFWEKLKSYVIENYPGISQDWKFYSKKAGWSLVFKQKSRTLFYFVPCHEYFMIAFVLGEKAAKTAEQSSISEHIKKTIAAATPYVEGKSFFVDVKNEKDLESVYTLLKIKEES
ncbi:MAG: DUF3788 domain-containing protein [Methanosarcinales archaeon]|jgi:hypothetical protein|nr:DUF3788 domain-containing protein [Methanosarcinales archaeon]